MEETVLFTDDILVKANRNRIMRKDSNNKCRQPASVINYKTINGYNKSIEK